MQTLSVEEILKFEYFFIPENNCGMRTIEHFNNESHFVPLKCPPKRRTEDMRADNRRNYFDLLRGNNS